VDAKVLGNQILKSGTSVGAHYREACRAKSNADFISKVEGALQELDETAYWLELIGEAEILPANRLRPLHEEAEELIAILVTIVTKVKRKNLAAFAKLNTFILHPSAFILELGTVRFALLPFFLAGSASRGRVSCRGASAGGVCGFGAGSVRGSAG